MKSRLLAIVSSALLVAACKKHDEPLPPLAGTWMQVDIQANFTGAINTMTFSDSGGFRIKRRLWSDAFEPGNPCSGNRMQYMRGSYVVSDRQLTLDGHYCDSTYTADIPDCALGITYFNERFSMSSSDGKLILNCDGPCNGPIILQRQ